MENQERISTLERELESMRTELESTRTQTRNEMDRMMKMIRELQGNQQQQQQQEQQFFENDDMIDLNNSFPTPESSEHDFEENVVLNVLCEEHT